MLFADGIPESTGAYIIAILGFLGAVHAKMDARRVARDKQQSDVRMAEIAAEHDSKIVALETQHAACEEGMAALGESLKECQAGHQETQQRLAVSEAERVQMKSQISVLESKVA